MSSVFNDFVPSTMNKMSERDLQYDHLSGQEKAHLEASGSERESSDRALPKPGTQRLENDKLEPIAVIGFAARLPQDATTAESFWQMLCDERSARTEIPQDRFNIDAFYHPDPDRIDATNVRTGNFLVGDISAFDAPFFSIQPTEVASMDPQQRIMLETSYQAIENAGLPMNSVVGSKTCVYVGSSARDYEALLLRDPESPAKYLGTGIGTSLLANRISWFYDFRGPSIALDTACSSSMIALHLACLSLRNHESDLGLAGGCNLILAPDVSMVHLSSMGFFSPDGRCFTFDQRANGYAKGEGAGVVVIKLLKNAIKDGDTIRAVIRATGTNQDGKTPGLTQPSKAAQEENILATYHAGGLNLDTTKYFEAHGTGTQIGDPIEAEAISAAFRKSKEDPIYVGTVKPNIGHLESASGVASLIKAILVLEKGLIPPNINFECPNVSIPMEDWHIKFPLSITPWPTSGLRQVSVNSFGYGGSNAHCVLNDAFNYLKIRGIRGKHCTASIPPRPEESCSDLFLHNYGESTLPKAPKVFVWSAANEESVRRLAGLYKEFLSTLPFSILQCSDAYLDHLAYTMSNKRSSLPWKSYVVADSCETLQQKFASGLSKPLRSSLSLTLSFLFTGQGAQWVGMGTGLAIYPVFRESLRRSEDSLRALGCHMSLMDKFEKGREADAIDNPAVAQPLCTALQVALVDLLASWGVFPVAIVGHSSGEITAAYCAGSLSQDSAMKVSFYRGYLAAELAKSSRNRGAMASVAMSENAITPYLDDMVARFGRGRLTIGCINSPDNVTVTGDVSCVDALVDLMSEKGVFARKLQINVAYHSAYMEDIADRYSEFIRDIFPRTDSPGLKTARKTPAIFSSVTGTLLSAHNFSHSKYWLTNLVSKVRFSDALTEMRSYLLSQKPNRSSGKDIFAEIGPAAALQRPVRDTINQMVNSKEIEYQSVLRRGVSGLGSCLEFIGRLHCSGYKFNLLPINSPALRKSDLRLLTNLPQYPFNHQQSYWTESRVSRNFRTRKHGRHELLGTPSADWNPAEPKWRNVIRFSESPWIVDHKLGGNVLYPAGGMMVMAIEATRQLADPSRAINSYWLKDLFIHRALLVSDSPEGVETQLFLRRRKASVKSLTEFNDFKIYAYANDEWSLVCEGTVKLAYEDQFVERANNQELDDDMIRSTFDAGVKSCKEVIHSTQFYKNLAKFGFDFGPTFQALENIRYSREGEAVATIKLDGWRSKIASGQIKDHVIHPTAMDGLFQLAMAAISNGSWDTIPTMVPTQLKSLWISNDLLKRTVTSEIKTYTKSTFLGFREADFQIFALSSKGDAQIIVHGWRETALSTVVASSADGLGLKCYHVDWKPDPELMESAELAAFCEAVAPNTAVSLENTARQLEAASAFFVMSTLQIVPHKNEDIAPYLLKYVEWMQRQSTGSRIKTLLEENSTGKRILDDESSREDFLHGLAASTPEGEYFVTVGRNLTNFISGEVHPHEILSEKEITQKIYSSPGIVSSYAKIGTYIDLLAHKNPALRILEVGAKTDSVTHMLLRSLCSSAYNDDDEGTLRCNQYTCTDTSSALLKNAAERFKVNASRMSFAVLDLEKDPLEQGFEAQQYDLVICNLIARTSADLNKALQNVRILMKAGGKLILLESTNPESLRASFVLGLLPSWWQAVEERRKLCPLLSTTDWEETLRENGFSGTDICLPDSSDAKNHSFSVIISTASDVEVATIKLPPTIIIVDESCPKQNEIATKIKISHLLTDVCPCEVITIQDLKSKDLSSTICIFLLEVEEPYLVNMSEDHFMALKNMVKYSTGIIWVTHGCGEKSIRPDLGLVTGFGRNVGSESWGVRFFELALEFESPASQMINQIMKVYRKALLDNEGEDVETEYMEKDGKLHISRVVEAQYLNKAVGAKTVRQSPQPQKFGSDTTRSLHLTIASPGFLNTFRFEDDVDFQTNLAPDEVEIKVQATGVNFKDVMIALGQLAGNKLGYECAGTVTRIGRSVDLRPGDRVLCCTNTGGFNTYARAHKTSVTKIPTHMSFCAAAALPTAFCTAYYALLTLGHLQEGESVLIHSGAGGVGQAAIQLANIVGAHIFTTVGTQEKREFLTKSYGIPPDHIFSSRDTLFSKALRRVTDGVDVVLNSLSGEGLCESWSCIRPLGRFIELGKADINSNASLPMSPFSQNVTFCSVDLGVVMDKAKPVMAATLKAVMALLEEPVRIFCPQPLHVYKISDLERAFRLMQSGKHMGKIVVETDDDSIVSVMPSSVPTYSFEQDASYLIAGGLGGLGRAITRWMVSRGARNLILLSRSGAKSKETIDLIEELKSRGVEIAAPPCDVSVEDEVSTTLEKYRSTMPPIKGCIQASMVLKDGLFENLTLPDFKAAIIPKVQGSWNLHMHLPSNLDFFVLLSSVCGVTGTRGQSNYAAGNSYQDALARHRVSLGEKCISLDLGAILSIGVAAEKDLSESLDRDGFVGLSKGELFALLDHCCDPSTPLRKPWASQVLTGLGALEQGRQVYWTQKPLFCALRNRSHVAPSDGAGASGDSATLLKSATSQAAAEDVVLQALKLKLSHSLSIPVEDIDENKPIFAFGIDSLVALEVRYWFQKTLKAQVSVFDIMQAKSLLGLAGVAAGESELWGRK